MLDNATSGDNLFRISLILLGVSIIATTGLFYFHPETFYHDETLLPHHSGGPTNEEEDNEEGDGDGSSSSESEGHGLVEQLNQETIQNPTELELAASPPPEVKIDEHEFEHDLEGPGSTEESRATEPVPESVPDPAQVPKPEAVPVPVLEPKPVTRTLAESMSGQSIRFGGDDTATF